MRIKTISPTKAAILTCAATLGAVSLIPQTESFSVNFVYNDLLAHPQYDVQFPKEVIPASSISSQHNTHRRQSAQRLAQIETTKTGTEKREQEPSGTVHESPSTMVMTDADGMRWSCMIPPKLVVEVKATPKLSPQEIEEEERRSVQRGLELLDHLTGHCLQLRRDYWTYEYCHKKSIRQYHAVQSNGQWIPETEDTTYVLAQYQSGATNVQGHPDNEGALQQRSSSSSVGAATGTATELEVSNERKYLVQRWDHGDICDITGLARKVEVRFKCAPVGDHIQAVTEPATCSYIMEIYSPNLCKDTTFENVPAPEANKIECRRIISDEQYQKLKASVPEAIDGTNPEGAAGIVQDHNAQIKLGQVPRQPETEQRHQTTTNDKIVADAETAILTNFKDILELANQFGDPASQKKLEDVMAKYEAYVESIKAMMTPEHRAVYEDIEKLFQGIEPDQDRQAAASMKDPVDALFGTNAEPSESSEPSAGSDKMEKKKQMQDATTGGADTTANAAAAADDSKQASSQEPGQEREATKEEKEGQAKL
ncbi:Protein OS-9 [Mortierella sp. AD031]|nr:Protein OS-9 [Mortierella sp. AD031]KAG0216162.1 Protein OS-9 [Mortierella sp. NVP41]